jgi:hypothetical protein
MEQDHHPDDDHVDKARPVSGEIMSAGVARETRSRTAADVSDAQYETLPATRSDAPARFGDAGTAAAGMDFLKSGVAGNGGTRRGGVFFWLCGILLVGLAFWFSGGHALIAGNGQTGVAAGSPLHIADVKSRVENRDGRSVLFIDGRAENRGGQALRLPPIEIAVTANEGGVTRYELATRDTELKPGDRYSFSSRLEAPASGVKTVSVAFQEGER